MIIGLAGRMGGGKTLLSSMLLERNFTKIAFADYFKSKLAEVYDIDLSLFKDPLSKNEVLNSPIIWNKNYALKLFQLCDIKDFSLPIKDQKFYSRRDLMQYVGSDVLRAYDEDFHINKTMNSLSKDKDYIFDDFRFLNELNAIKKLSGKVFYILRPSNTKISNHISETSINWSDCDYRIVNNSSIDSFKDTFFNFIDIVDNASQKDKLTKINQSLLKNNYNLELVSDEFNVTVKTIKKWSDKYLLNLNKFYYDKFSFLKPNSRAAYYAGQLSGLKPLRVINNSALLKVTSKSDSFLNGLKDFTKSNRPISFNKRNYQFIIDCPFIIENMKYWNIDNSIYNNIPDIIKNDKRLLSIWYLGLLESGKDINLTEKDELLLKKYEIKISK